MRKLLWVVIALLFAAQAVAIIVVKDFECARDLERATGWRQIHNMNSDEGWESKETKNHRTTAYSRAFVIDRELVQVHYRRYPDADDGPFTVELVRTYGDSQRVDRTLIFSSMKPARGSIRLFLEPGEYRTTVYTDAEMWLVDVEQRVAGTEMP